MAAQTSVQAWPSWARALLVLLTVIAVLTILPWTFMWSTMAASCLPMMNGMREMMGPEMMR